MSLFANTPQSFNRMSFILLSRGERVMAFFKFLKKLKPKEKKEPEAIDIPPDIPPLPGGEAVMPSPDIPDFSMPPPVGGAEHPDLPPFPPLEEEKEKPLPREAPHLPPLPEAPHIPEPPGEVPIPPHHEKPAPKPPHSDMIPPIPELPGEVMHPHHEKPAPGPHPASSHHAHIPPVPEPPIIHPHEEKELPKDMFKDVPDIHLPEYKEEEKPHEHLPEPRKPVERKVDTSRPLFINVEDYIGVISNANTIKSNLKECDDAVTKLLELNRNEEMNFNKWKRAVESSQRGLMHMDTVLFKKR